MPDKLTFLKHTNNDGNIFIYKNTALLVILLMIKEYMLIVFFVVYM